jgi:hypothetical protein
MTTDAARRIQSTQTKNTGGQPTKQSFTARTTSAAAQNKQGK